MNTIKRYAHALQLISILLAVAMFALLCIRWFFDIPFYTTDLYAKIAYCWDSGIVQELQSMPLLSRMCGFIVDGVALCILVVGIIFFNRFIQHFKRNSFFSSDSIHLLNILSKIAVCWALYNPLRIMLLSLITTLHKGPGQRMISLSIGTSDLINIGIFMVFVVLTSVMQEGNKLKQEHDATI